MQKNEEQSVVTKSTIKRVTALESVNESTFLVNNADSVDDHGRSKVKFLNPRLSARDSISDVSSQRSDHELPWNLLMSVDSKSLNHSKRFEGSFSPTRIN